MQLYDNSHAFAQTMDSQDPLRHFRNEFHIPQHNGADCIYFCGNSLGLQPRQTTDYIAQELNGWASLGVEGHFDSRYNWYGYHHFLTDATARLVGAQPHEVAVMNALTVNLHLLMATFYRPTSHRYKILIEAPAFPSDRYAVQSQALWHGFAPQEAIVVINPNPETQNIDNQYIVDAIAEHGEELALVLIGAVNYYSGQFFDLPRIVAAAHSVGAYVGFDCAHAAGNVLLHLHDWQVDFAAWCSYKYLNSGPGGVSGVFIHERYADRPDLPRLAGWWGNDENHRFTMSDDFVPQRGAGGWQMSNAPVLAMAAHRAALDLFDRATMPTLRQKGDLLTGYAEYWLQELNRKYGNSMHIITPKNTNERGSQLSVLMQEHNGKAIFDELTQHGVIADWRRPNVIRIAPVPLYNTFEDIYRFAQLLDHALHKCT